MTNGEQVSIQSRITIRQRIEDLEEQLDIAFEDQRPPHIIDEIEDELWDLNEELAKHGDGWWN